MHIVKRQNNVIDRQNNRDVPQICEDIELIVERLKESDASRADLLKLKRSNDKNIAKAALERALTHLETLKQVIFKDGCYIWFEKLATDQETQKRIQIHNELLIPQLEAIVFSMDEAMHRILKSRGCVKTGFEDVQYPTKFPSQIETEAVYEHLESYPEIYEPLKRIELAFLASDDFEREYHNLINSKKCQDLILKGESHQLSNKEQKEIDQINENLEKLKAQSMRYKIEKGWISEEAVACINGAVKDLIASIKHGNPLKGKCCLCPDKNNTAKTLTNKINSSLKLSQPNEVDC